MGRERKHKNSRNSTINLVAKLEATPMKQKPKNKLKIGSLCKYI